jgi:hypothetical protein
MPDHDRLFDIKLNERLVNEFSLSIWCPNLRPWPARVTEARAIHGYDAISLGQRLKHSADLKILQHRTVAVQQDERRSLASLEIVEVDPFNIEEAAGGWVFPLRPSSAPSDEQSRGS